MPLAHVHPADSVAYIGTIDPEATGAGTVVSGWLDAGDFHAFMGVVQVGTMGTNATVDAKFQQATDSSGTGAKDITGAAITQMTQAGTDQSDTEAIISVQNDSLDVDGGFRYIQFSVTVGTAATDLAGAVLGIPSRIGPASDSNATTVGEVVRA